jgi:ribose 5-phosphate isomerase B
MRVYLGSDHAGFALKARLIAHLGEQGHDPVDCGAPVLAEDDDYPPYCIRVATLVVANPDTLGIVIGGSGNGEAIAANKVRGARCALAFSDDTARLGREHNNANVLSLGARMYDEATAIRFTEIFLATPFSGAERHVRRLDLIADYEGAAVRAMDPGDAVDGGR